MSTERWIILCVIFAVVAFFAGTLYGEATMRMSLDIQGEQVGGGAVKRSGDPVPTTALTTPPTHCGSHWLENTFCPNTPNRDLLKAIKSTVRMKALFTFN